MIAMLFSWETGMTHRQRTETFSGRHPANPLKVLVPGKHKQTSFVIFLVNLTTGGRRKQRGAEKKASCQKINEEQEVRGRRGSKREEERRMSLVLISHLVEFRRSEENRDIELKSWRTRIRFLTVLCQTTRRQIRRVSFLSLPLSFSGGKMLFLNQRTQENDKST